MSMRVCIVGASGKPGSTTPFSGNHLLRKRLRSRIQSRVRDEPDDGETGEPDERDVARQAPEAGGAKRDKLDAYQIEGDNRPGERKT